MDSARSLPTPRAGCPWRPPRRGRRQGSASFPNAGRRSWMCRLGCENPVLDRGEARGRWLRACPRDGGLVRRQRARCRVVLFGDEGCGVLVRERVRRLSGGIPAVRDQSDRPRASQPASTTPRRTRRRFSFSAGECRLVVEGEERRLRAWDFFHSPPWTEHAFVGAGDRPCVILMVGAHVGPEARYPVSELAARYGASVEKETSDPEQVYATAERFRRGRPPYWSRLPWG